MEKKLSEDSTKLEKIISAALIKEKQKTEEYRKKCEELTKEKNDYLEQIKDNEIYIQKLQQDNSRLKKDLLDFGQKRKCLNSDVYMSYTHEPICTIHSKYLFLKYSNGALSSSGHTSKVLVIKSSREIAEILFWNSGLSSFRNDATSFSVVGCCAGASTTE